MTYELRVLEGAGEIEQSLRLRARVWRDANVVLPVDVNGCHRDGDDAAATHFGVLIDGRVVASSRVSLLPGIDSLPFAGQLWLDASRYPGRACYLSRLVVAPEARGLGLARGLIERMVIHARENRAAWTAATSSVRVVEDILLSLRFAHADDVRFRWGHDWRSDRVFIAGTAAATLEVHQRARRRGSVAATRAAV